MQYDKDINEYVDIAKHITDGFRSDMANAGKLELEVAAEIAAALRFSAGFLTVPGFVNRVNLDPEVAKNLGLLMLNVSNGIELGLFKQDDPMKIPGMINKAMLGGEQIRAGRGFFTRLAYLVECAENGVTPVTKDTDVDDSVVFQVSAES